MRYPPALIDEIRQRLPVSQVVARRVKLKRQGREYVGLSPFKHEKTPSFTVNDQKGFYHCFSTGEHGDIFTFLMKTEGLSFIEAVERLAKDAGVALPKPTPQMVEREAEFDRLRRITEASCAFFEAQLRASSGKAARDYLAQRGVGDDEIATFRLGYAPESRTALKQHLASLGFAAEDAVTAGMLIGGEGIAVPYDRFRNRLMFPIADLSGAVIAFGGRALGQEQQPKYLNSPETPLFHKGSVLFNAARARKNAHERGTVIVAEGYMDVIALARAGFTNAVAPLGTALSEEQLRLLWRMAEEPVMCFDGDAAGRRAAYRTLGVALPHLLPAQSLRFAFLPDGLDPDDLVRSAGAEAMGRVIAAAEPLIDVLWRMETEAAQLTTPEMRAAFEARMLALASEIRHPLVRGHYVRELKSKLWQLWRQSSGPRPANGSAHAPRGGAGAAGWRHAKPWQAAGQAQRGEHPVLPGALKSRLTQSAAFLPHRREAHIIQALLNNPWLLDDGCEDAAALAFESPGLGALRDAIVDAYTQQNPLDKDGLRHQLKNRGLGPTLALVEQATSQNCDWHTQPDADKTSVMIGWRHMVALHRKSSELKRELEAAEQAYFQDQSEENFLRLQAVREDVLSADGVEAAIEGYRAQGGDRGGPDHRPDASLR